MNVIVISSSSDIGEAACHHWLEVGWNVFGTYRTDSARVARLLKEGARLVPCDLNIPSFIGEACSQLKSLCRSWDVLLLAAGTQDPISPFSECDIDEWEDSIRINFISQLRIVREMMSARSRKSPPPTVIFFAGGGTNNSVVNYSAYTVSKIALIKMCELLDAEESDTKFSIVGPGWVKTKIHAETLRAGGKAGANLERTKARLEGSDWTPMEKVLACCDWIVRAPRAIVSGRNFSVVHDAWGSEPLEDVLRKDANIFKLRRFGNEISLKTSESKVK